MAFDIARFGDVEQRTKRCSGPIISTTSVTSYSKSIRADIGGGHYEQRYSASDRVICTSSYSTRRKPMAGETIPIRINAVRDSRCRRGEARLLWLHLRRTRCDV